MPSKGSLPGSRTISRGGYYRFAIRPTGFRFADIRYGGFPWRRSIPGLQRRLDIRFPCRGSRPGDRTNAHHQERNYRHCNRRSLVHVPYHSLLSGRYHCCRILSDPVLFRLFFNEFHLTHNRPGPTVPYRLDALSEASRRVARLGTIAICVDQSRSHCATGYRRATHNRRD